MIFVILQDQLNERVSNIKKDNEKTIGSVDSAVKEHDIDNNEEDEEENEE